eukprot:m.84209 g.84209  ORF g.84209 m.84209 type:complete len:142 (-) comp25722_c0_seq1:276-701(-)
MGGTYVFNLIGVSIFGVSCIYGSCLSRVCVVWCSCVVMFVCCGMLVAYSGVCRAFVYFMCRLCFPVVSDTKEEVKAVTCWQQMLSKANNTLGQIIQANAKTNASVHFLKSQQYCMEDELEKLRCGHVKISIRIPPSVDSLF